MKTTIITLVLIGVFMMGGVALAFGTYKITPNESFERITSSLIDVDGIIVYKFKDGNTTCYGSYKQGTYANAVAISCK